MLLRTRKNSFALYLRIVFVLVVTLIFVLIRDFPKQASKQELSKYKNIFVKRLAWNFFATCYSLPKDIIFKYMCTLAIIESIYL